MICYWLEYNKTRGTGWSRHARHRPRPTVERYVGDVTLKRNGDVICGVRVKAMITMFDDRTTPPTLIRDDYTLHTLALLKGDLPPAYIDGRGNICQTQSGEYRRVIMSGE